MNTKGEKMLDVLLFVGILVSGIVLAIATADAIFNSRRRWGENV